MSSAIRTYLVALSCSVVLLFAACENPVIKEELSSGDSLLMLHANYANEISVAQFFNAGELFRVKQNPFIRHGYAFLGWTDSPSSRVIMFKNRSEMSFRSDKDLYAVWELKSYSITYEGNGGRRIVDYPETFTIEQGTVLNQIHNGKYIFGGWYDNKDFQGLPVTQIQKGTVGDKTFYARWCGKLVYNLNGGSLPSLQPDETLSAVIAEDSPAETPLSEDAQEPVSEDQPTSAEELAGADNNEDETLVSLSMAESEPADPMSAVDEKKEDSALSAQEDVVFADAESEPLPEESTKTTVQESENVAVDTSEVEADDEGLQEQPLSSDDGNDSASVAEKMVTSCFTIHSDVTLQVPVRENYVFGGWYYDEKFTKPANFMITNASAPEIQVYAKWNEVRTYAIAYELDGGENARQNADSYENSDKPILLEEPAKYGYDFDGWYESQDFSGSPVTGIEAFAVGDKVFYAKWKRATFTVTYCMGNAQAGKLPKAQSALYESEVTLSGNEGGLSLEDCLFAGWTVIGDEKDMSFANLSDEDESLAEEDEKERKKELQERKMMLQAQERVAANTWTKAGERYAVLGNVNAYPVWELVEYEKKENQNDSGRKDEKRRKKVIPKNRVTEVVLPGYVTVFGPSVFSGFSSLKDIDLTGITTIRKHAFANCTALTKLDLRKVRRIEKGAFAGCSGLKKVLLPEICESLEKEIFSDCADNIIFVAPKEKLDYYTKLLVPAVVGKPEKTYLITEEE